jgi:hypothetical protein
VHKRSLKKSELIKIRRDSSLQILWELTRAKNRTGQSFGAGEIFKAEKRRIGFAG